MKIMKHNYQKKKGTYKQKQNQEKPSISMNETHGKEMDTVSIKPKSTWNTRATLSTLWLHHES